MTRILVAALLAFVVASSPPCHAANASEAAVGGFGAWRFGMSAEEVARVTDAGPYSPVASTGGLETANGRFEGKKTNVSFIFGPQGLRRIQIWAYEGHDFDAAAEAFYTVYRHLESHFGGLKQDDAAYPAGLAPEAFRQRIPASFRDTSQVTTPDKILAQESEIRLQMEKVQLCPQHDPQGATVFTTFAHSPRLGTYWVFLYYDAPAPGR